MPHFQSPLSTISQSFRWTDMSIPWSLLPYPSRSLERSPPNRAPAKKDVPFPEPSNFLLKFPVIGLPRFPSGSRRREASFSRTSFYTFPSKSLVNEHRSMFSSMFMLLENNKLYLKALWQFMAQQSSSVKRERAHAFAPFAHTTLCWPWNYATWCCVIEQVPMLYGLLSHMQPTLEFSSSSSQI